jgi:hypothetical protein
VVVNSKVVGLATGNETFLQIYMQLHTHCVPKRHPFRIKVDGRQGCQIFLVSNIPKLENIPN